MTTTPTRVYLSVRDLPVSVRPCYVTRSDRSTLLVIQPGAPRLDVWAWVVDHLTVEEQNALREGHDQPPVGWSMDDSLLDGRMAYDVPAPLRLPQEADLWLSRYGRQE